MVFNGAYKLIQGIQASERLSRTGLKFDGTAKGSAEEDGLTTTPVEIQLDRSLLEGGVTSSSVISVQIWSDVNLRLGATAAKCADAGTAGTAHTLVYANSPHGEPLADIMNRNSAVTDPVFFIRTDSGTGIVYYQISYI